ncbi:MAG TPA: 2-phospho-L-lactate transferase CofD family protein, partial [Anaerolineales bacterium]|nr:2-phospho-L-lactate transferase CofD family protein [Anaerolineales bacterium]
RVRGFRFEGVEAAEPAPGVKEAIQAAEAVIICPSNPWVSINPILRVVKSIEKPVIAVSPIIGGKTVKGPAAKMYYELGIEPSAVAVARQYCDLITGFVFDTLDRQLENEIKSLNLRTLVTNTLMHSHDDRKHLASHTLSFIGKVL